LNFNQLLGQMSWLACKLIVYSHHTYIDTTTPNCGWTIPQSKLYVASKPKKMQHKEKEEEEEQQQQQEVARP
jgi:hypothetical protein